MKSYNIIQKRNIWLGISGVFVGLSILALIFWGLRFGIDFTGGSLLEVRFAAERPAVTEVNKALTDPSVGGLSSLTVQSIGETDMVMRFQETSEEKHQAVLAALEKLAGNEQAMGSSAEKQEQSSLEELRFDSVGPSIGQELKSKSFYAIILVLIAIVLFISWSFRKVSKPVASWKYGTAAVIALFHDTIITLGIFSFLGHFYGTEINTPFIAAILTVIGYSVNDTIVVFDRIRENLPKSDEDFEGTINTSINQTLVRSINTSLTVLLALLAIIVFGGASIRELALALAIGIFIGTYSSIFVASPILVVWEKLKNKQNS